jgi:hypothetical protein
MHDVDTTRTTFIGQQRLGEEEIEYGPDVPLGTRLRLELAHLHD